MNQGFGPPHGMMGPMGMMGMMGPMGLVPGGFMPDFPQQGMEEPGAKRARLDGPPGGSRADSIFYKTRLCLKFQQGACTFGDRCNYAHSPSELRPLAPEGYQILGRLEARRQREGGDAPGPGPGHISAAAPSDGIRASAPARPSPSASGASGSTPGPRAPSRPAQTPAAGEGSSCGAAAPRPPGDLPRAKAPTSTAPQPATGGSTETPAGPLGSRGRSAFYKTRLCFKFMDTGACGYGDRCNYAHGHHELMPGPGVRPPHAADGNAAPGGPLPMDMPLGFEGPFHPMMGPGGPGGVGPMAMGPLGPVPSLGLVPGGPPMPRPPVPPPGPPPTGGVPPPRPPAGPAPSARGRPAAASGPESAASGPGPAEPADAARVVAAVPYLDRTRALCVLLGLSAFKEADLGPAAMAAGAASLASGDALRASAYADSLEGLVRV